MTISTSQKDAGTRAIIIEAINRAIDYPADHLKTPEGKALEPLVKGFREFSFRLLSQSGVLTNPGEVRNFLDLLKGELVRHGEPFNSPAGAAFVSGKIASIRGALTSILPDGESHHDDADDDEEDGEAPSRQNYGKRVRSAVNRKKSQLIRSDRANDRVAVKAIQEYIRYGHPMDFKDRTEMEAFFKRALESTKEEYRSIWEELRVIAYAIEEGPTTRRDRIATESTRLPRGVGHETEINLQTVGSEKPLQEDADVQSALSLLREVLETKAKLGLEGKIKEERRRILDEAGAKASGIVRDGVSRAEAEVATIKAGAERILSEAKEKANEHARSIEGAAKVEASRLIETAQSQIAALKSAAEAEMAQKREALEKELREKQAAFFAKMEQAKNIFGNS